MTLDDQLSVLSNQYRRQLLLALADNTHHDKLPVSSDAVETDGGDREHAITMHHVHLPRLEDHGFISWNQETGEVAKGPQFDEIEPLLTVLTEVYEDTEKPLE